MSENQEQKNRQDAIRRALRALVQINAETTPRTNEAQAELDDRISSLRSALKSYAEGDETNGLLHLMCAMNGSDKRNDDNLKQ